VQGPPVESVIGFLFQIADLYQLPTLTTTLAGRLTHIDRAVAAHALQMAYLIPLERKGKLTAKEQERFQQVYQQHVGLLMVYSATAGLVDPPWYARGGWPHQKKERYFMLEDRGGHGSNIPTVPQWAVEAGRLCVGDHTL
jgi:hypothetical protein